MDILFRCFACQQIETYVYNDPDVENMSVRGREHVVQLMSKKLKYQRCSRCRGELPKQQYTDPADVPDFVAEEPIATWLHDGEVTQDAFKQSIAKMDCTQ